MWCAKMKGITLYSRGNTLHSVSKSVTVGTFLSVFCYGKGRGGRIYHSLLLKNLSEHNMFEEIKV